MSSKPHPRAIVFSEQCAISRALFDASLDARRVVWNSWIMSPELVLPVIISNVLAIVLFAAAAQWPRVTRIVFGCGFIATGFFNAYTALYSPRVYVDGYGPLAIGPYRDFIYGAFARHTMYFVLAIAAGQLVAGILALLPRLTLQRLGLAGMVVFLLAITGLGWGSGFPAGILLAAAAILCLRTPPRLVAERGNFVAEKVRTG